MKICLYLEFYHFLGGRLLKNTGSGIFTSYRNQRVMLESLKIPFVEKWDDSCDILQTNTPWLKSIWLMKKARRQGKKVIIWAHATVEDGMAVFRFFPLIAPLMKKYYSYAYGLADVVFCPSAYTKSLLLAYGLPEAKLVVQSNAVNLQKFFPDAQKKQAGRAKYALEKFTVGSVGQVQPRKGLDTFLAMAKKFPNCQFIYFGNFFNSLIVKSLPKNLPGNVKFTGYVEDINEAYNTLDVFTFPSIEENQGMAILEAAAVGLPILVRDIPAYQGWLEHGKNCLKAKTEEEFLILLSRLVTDAELRLRLSEGAKKLAGREDLNHASEKLLSTYNKLLGK